MTPELIIAIEVCLKAGKSMLRRDCCHVSGLFDEYDSGLSPEEAGLEVHRLITHSLAVAGLPVLGAYGEGVSYEVRSGWRQFWLVAPVDREPGLPEATVSVALIDGHEPVLGVVYAPATDELYCASREAGAYRVRYASSTFAETTRLFSPPRKPAVPSTRPSRLLVSRLHLDEQMLGYIEELGRDYPGIDLLQREGTLNFCMVAAGDAELYPRLDTTSEWDTAAGHAILKATGKSVVDIYTGRELWYNKPEMVNPQFIAR
jgi:3'(2'), 5'-bisphosphate nucleotidase